ncbi:hypothetical protein OXX79_006405 [Metschnikowia pulcherrima]|nr:hypothetical protein OY671_002590 [Metschnikowia pulcherrima]
MNGVVTKKRNRISPEMVKMLAFFKYRLSGSKGTPSSSDGGGELDELDESDEEMGGEMDGDSGDAARTSKGKNSAAVEIVI